MTFQNLSRSRLLSPNHSQAELNSSHAKCDVWNRSHFARTVRAARSHLTLRSSAIKELALNCFKRRILHGSNAINWIRAMQDATFETGLRCDKPQLKTKNYWLRYMCFWKYRVVFGRILKSNYLFIRKTTDFLILLSFLTRFDRTRFSLEALTLLGKVS